MPLTASDGLSGIELDQQQHRVGGGPSIRALDQGIVAEGWIPQSGQPSRATLAVPLCTSGRANGAISWYSALDQVFHDADKHTAKWFTDEAARTLNIAQTMALSGSIDQFHETLETRATIDLARGIVMAWRGCGPSQATQELRTLSQNTNTTLSELATALTSSVSDPDPERLSAVQSGTSRPTP
jgi:hypothetical protein